MPVIDVYAARKEAEVMRDTWGHLAPTPGRLYSGYAILCRTPNSEEHLLDYDFEGLDGNPWTYEHVGGWWSTVMDRLNERGPKDQICLWRWEGTYKLFRNGSPRFSAGKIIPLRIVDRFPQRRRST